MARTKAWGLGLALTSSVCFGGSGVFGKALIGAGLSPLEAVWLRIAGAALVLLPVALLLRGPGGLRAAAPFWRELLLYGFAGVAACQAFYFVAASRLPVGIAILLEFTGPVLVLGWVRLVRRTRVQRSAAIGVVVAMAGLACVVEVWSGLGLDPLGLLAGLGAAVCMAAYFLIVEHLTGDVDPLTMTAVGSVIGVAVLAPLAAPWALPWSVLSGRAELGGGTVPAWVAAACVILICTVLSYVTGVAAVQRLSAQVAGALGYVEAVAATVLAWALLGERLSPVQLAGGAIIITGAFIAQRATTTAPHAPAVELPEPALAR